MSFLPCCPTAGQPPHRPVFSVCDVLSGRVATTLDRVRRSRHGPVRGSRRRPSASTAPSACEVDRAVVGIVNDRCAVRRLRAQARRNAARNGVRSPCAVSRRAARASGLRGRQAELESRRSGRRGCRVATVAVNSSDALAAVGEGGVPLDAAIVEGEAREPGVGEVGLRGQCRRRRRCARPRYWWTRGNVALPPQ